MTVPLEIAVLVAFAISLAGTYLVRNAALRLQWLDHPSQRKMHTNPIPVLGGIAIYIAFLITFLLTNSRQVLEEGIIVLIGATLLLVVGVIDDQRGLRPRTKLLAQVAAALLLIVGGIGVEFLPFPWLNAVVTVLWVVGICNAMNLLDNMDGLSAGVAAIACAFFTLLALWHGQIWVSIVAAVLLGAIVGFLRFNWNPATIFMGDAGSLLLGYLLAVLALKLRFSDVDPRRTWLIPILILAVPIFDTTVVMLSRARRGIAVSSGGRDHVSHRLVRMGLSVREAVLTIYLAALICGGIAILAILLPDIAAVYGTVSLLGIGGLAALIWLERVDLSDTGQVSRSQAGSQSERDDHIETGRHTGARRVHRVLRPRGVRRLKPLGNARRWLAFARQREEQITEGRADSSANGQVGGRQQLPRM